MVDIFTQILDMSLMGSVIIILVMLCRMLLCRVPRIYSYVLWFAVLFRLLCPVTLVSPVSLMPENMDVDHMVRDWSGSVVEDTVRYEAGSQEFSDAVQRGDIAFLRHEADGSYILVARDDLGSPDTVASTWLPVISNIWLVGLVALGAGSMVSFLKLRRRLVGAVPHDDGYYLADHIDTPFVVGVILPKIYLPSDLPESHRPYILAHEKHHVRRFDHLVKLAAFSALCLHWFNPLAWLMFHLLVKDMEMSCDEAVLNNLGREIRSDYSALLLSLSAGSHRVAWTPLAFGEGDISERIKNVLSWRKPAAWITVLALLLTCAVTVSAVTDPVSDDDSLSDSLKDIDIIYAEILESHDHHLADTLTAKQQQNIGELLQSMEENDFIPVKDASFSPVFSVRTLSAQGEMLLYFGYRGGESRVVLEFEDETYLLQDQQLHELLYHFYICRGSISIDYGEVPVGVEPSDVAHGNGCITSTYDYYCHICDRYGKAVNSVMCGCNDCDPHWEALLNKIRPFPDHLVD